jgi:DUF4097 and DUF4098 domain-containing protein YvlB
MEFLRTLTRDFEVGDKAELAIDNRAGMVTARSEDTKRVRVEIVARLWAESEDEADDQMELVARGVRQESKRVIIRAPALPQSSLFMLFGRGSRIEYQVTAPRSSTGTVLSRSGRVEIENLAGPLSVEARSGRVAVRQIRGDTRIVSRSGSVQAASIGVRVSDCAGSAIVVSRSGSVQIEDVGGSIKIESHSGSVRYEGAVRGDFDINVRSGSMRLSVDSDSSFFLDAESAHGAVRSDMPLRRGGAAARAGGPTVRVRTRSGSIHIAPR